MDRKEVLKAWLDGETIQYKQSSSQQWSDHSKYQEGDKILFFGNTELRIKPKMAVSAVNVYVHKDQDVGTVSNTGVFNTVSDASSHVTPENNALLYLHTIVVYYDGGRMVQTSILNLNEPIKGDEAEW